MADANNKLVARQKKSSLFQQASNKQHKQQHNTRLLSRHQAQRRKNDFERKHEDKEDKQKIEKY